MWILKILVHSSFNAVMNSERVHLFVSLICPLKSYLFNLALWSLNATQRPVLLLRISVMLYLILLPIFTFLFLSTWCLEFYSTNNTCVMCTGKIIHCKCKVVPLQVMENYWGYGWKGSYTLSICHNKYTGGVALNSGDLILWKVIVVILKEVHWSQSNIGTESVKQIFCLHWNSAINRYITALQ